MSSKLNRPGKKPSEKLWDDKISHTYRTSYKDDSDLHILIFLAGDKATELISTALRYYSNANGIDISDSAIQEEICSQAGVIFAKTRIPPSAEQVMQSIGKTKLLKRLHSIIDSHDSGDTKPKLKKEPINKPQDNIADKSIPAEIASKETTQKLLKLDASDSKNSENSQPVQSLPPIASEASQIDSESVKSKKKIDVVDIGMGDEIEEEQEEAQVEDVSKLKNRWVSSHNY
jgi:hypothetical protein